MRNRRAELRGKFAVVAVLIGLGGAVASAAELNALTGLEVKPSAEGAQVVLRGTKAPTFTVFRLNDPDRLVVDVSSADASGEQGPPRRARARSPASSPRSSRTSARASAGCSSRSKLAAQYDVHADGNDVVISIDGSAPAAPAAVAEAPAPVEAKAEAQVAAAAAPPRRRARRAGRRAPRRSPPTWSRSRVDEIEVAHPARRITSLTFARGTLQIRADGEVAKYEVIELANPPRLAIDVYGVGERRAGAEAPLGRARLGADRRARREGAPGRRHQGRDARVPGRAQPRRGCGCSSASAAVARKGGPAKTPQVAVAAAEPKAEIEIDGQPVAVDEPGRVGADRGEAEVRALRRRRRARLRRVVGRRAARAQALGRGGDEGRAPRREQRGADARRGPAARSGSSAASTPARSAPR